MTALSHYAKFGENSRFRDVISEEKMRATKVEHLTEKVKNLTNYLMKFSSTVKILMGSRKKFNLC